MKFFLMVLMFPLLALFDCVAVAMLVPMPGFAVLLHLAIVALGYFALRAFIEEGHTGRRTIAVFAGLICLLTPVLGFIAVAVLLQGFCRPEEKPAPPSRFVVGNPRAQDQSTRRARSPIGEPLVYAFVHAPSAETHQLAIPILRHRLDRKAVGLLHKLSQGGDSKTRLFARSAISASVENREKILNQLRRETEENPRDSVAHHQLGELLFNAAESGLFDEVQALRFLRQASDSFEKCARLDPQNARAIFGKGLCLVRLAELDSVPEWYGRLCAVTNEPDGLAARLEAELFTADGSWERVRNVVPKLKSIDPASRKFWTPNWLHEPTGLVQRTDPVGS